MKIKINCILVLIILLTSSISFSSAIAKNSNLKSNLKTNSEEYDMVIISTEQFAESLIPLIEHKNSHGLLTFYKDVEKIYDEYQGRDKPEKIKYFIKDTIEANSISYVFIVGSIDFIPMRKSAIYIYAPEQLLPTDLYFADIYNETGEFCSWDANNNNIFSEFFQGKNIDCADCYADVNIGRIPCINNEELKIIVDKIINYENSAYGSDWFDNLLLLGIESQGNNIGDIMINYGFKSTKLYFETLTFSPKKINNEVTKGAGFISYSGHGSPEAIGADKVFFLPNLNIPIFYLKFRYKNHHLDGMNNEYKLPIVYLNACLTAKPEPITPRFPIIAKILKIPNKTSFAYNLVKKEGGGAIASIGANRLSAGAEFLQESFFINYEPGITVSEMLVKAQFDELEKGNNDKSSSENVQLYNLIGDPSLKVGGYP